MDLINKIYIIHYNKLVDRKKYIIDYFNNNNILNYEFRNLYQRENLTNDLRDNYFKLNNLTDAQICITIEHIETYKEIVNNGSYDKWYLILEDDAIFCENFLVLFNEYMSNIPLDAEYLDICDYFKIDSENMWERKYTTRTNCSYLINKRACEKILNTIIPFEKAIDHELNKQMDIHNIKTYWSNISLIKHGSSYNYSSSYTQF